MQSFTPINEYIEKNKFQTKEGTLDKVIKENQQLKQLFDKQERELAFLKSELFQLRTQTVALQYKKDKKKRPVEKDPEVKQSEYEGAGKRLEKQVKQMRDMLQSMNSVPCIDPQELLRSLEPLIEQVQTNEVTLSTKQTNTIGKEQFSQYLSQLFYGQQALGALQSVFSVLINTTKENSQEVSVNLQPYLEWIHETSKQVYSLIQMAQSHCFELLQIEQPYHTKDTSPSKSTNPFDDD